MRLMVMALCIAAMPSVAMGQTDDPEINQALVDSRLDPQAICGDGPASKELSRCLSRVHDKMNIARSRLKYARMSDPAGEIAYGEALGEALRAKGYVRSRLDALATPCASYGACRR